MCVMCVPEIMECGGKRSATPLCLKSRLVVRQNQRWPRGSKRRRRCALPAHSIGSGHYGQDLVNGGVTLFLKTDGPEIGPGHVAVLNDEGREFISFHVYDASLRGRSQLRLRTLKWSEDDWPVAGD
jgi:hypothetical protein